MATTTSLTTTYAGEVAGEWIRKAVNALESTPFITIKENINGRRVIRKLVDDAVFAEQTCDFTPTGTVTITERYLDLSWKQVHRNLCKKDFLDDWETGSMGPMKDNFPPTVQDFLLETISAALAAKLEYIIWKGDVANAGEIDGFLELIKADSAPVKVQSPEVLTAANIIAKMGSLLDAMDADATAQPILDATEKPLIYLNHKSARLYRRAMAALGYKQEFYAASIPMEFEGYQIAEVNGIGNDAIVIAQPSNLWFGTNVLSQMNDIQVLDMKELDASKNVRIAIDMAMAVNYGIGDEIGIYAEGIS